MTSRAQTRGDRFVEVSRSFHDILLGSRAFWVLRWMTLGMSLAEVASRSGFTCQQSLPTWGSTWMG
jgi:hypothetical protein